MDWTGKFQAFTTAALAGQVRMDARYAFTPEDTAYLLEIATRLEKLDGIEKAQARAESDRRSRKIAGWLDVGP